MPDPNQERRDELAKAMEGEGENAFQKLFQQQLEGAEGLKKFYEEKNRQATMEDIERLEKKLDLILTAVKDIDAKLDRIFGDNVILDGQWMKVKGIARGV